MTAPGRDRTYDIAGSPRGSPRTLATGGRKILSPIVSPLTPSNRTKTKPRSLIFISLAAAFRASATFHARNQLFAREHRVILVRVVLKIGLSLRRESFVILLRGCDSPSW